MNEKDQSPQGPVTLHEKPDRMLVNREAFALPEPAWTVDYLRAREWIIERGGEVPYVDDLGMLVRSVYLNEHGGDSGERYHEWIAAPALVVHDLTTGEFTQYGYEMHDRYEVRATSPGGGSDD